MSIPAHIKYLVISALFVVAAVNFSKTTLNIIESSKRLDETKQEVLSMETEKSKLEKELSYKNSDEFIEEKARNELNLIKPGERVFVVPEEISKKLGQTSEMFRKNETSNVQKWVNLFF